MPKETKDSAIEQIDSTVNEVVSNVENAKNVAMSLFHHNEQTVKTSNATLPIEVNAPYVRVRYHHPTLELNSRTSISKRLIRNFIQEALMKS